MNDPRMAQQSLVRVIELDPSSWSGWTKLDVSCALHDNWELIGKCFTQAQLVDPEYHVSWLGSSFSRLVMGQEHAPMVAHAYELGQAEHGDTLYHHAKNLYTNPTESNLAEASFCLLKCKERSRADSAALNLYGLVLEMQGVYSQSCQAFNLALDMCQKPEVIPFLVENYARVLCFDQQYEDSIQQ